MRRMTSSLNDAWNDTGRLAYCGPIVVSAISGLPVSRIEDEIVHFRRSFDGDVERKADGTVKGTTFEELNEALKRYDFTMELVESYEHLERKAQPSVWAWMQKPRQSWAHYVLGIRKGKQGHWIVIRGVKLCDTFTDGQWVFVTDGPHKGVKIDVVYKVRRLHDMHVDAS